MKKFTTFGAAIVVGALLFSGAGAAVAAEPSEWSDPVDVTAHGFAAYDQQLAVLPDGSLVAVWMWKAFSGDNSSIQTSTSGDNGATWSAAIDLTDGSDNANQPQVAVSPDGSVTVIWQEFIDGAWIARTRMSATPGTNWPTSAMSLSAAGGSVDDLRLAVSSDGLATVVWRRYSGSEWIVQTRTSDTSSAFGSDLPIDLSEVGENAYDPQLAVSSDGSVTVVWRRSNGSNDIVQTRTSDTPGTSWPNSAIDLSEVGYNAYNQALAVSSDGSVTVVWRRANGTNTIVQTRTSETPGTSWPTSAIDLSATGQDADNPKVAVSSDGSVTVVWRRSNGAEDIVQTKTSTTPSTDWPTSAIDLSATGQFASEPELAVGPDGSLLAVWVWSSGGRTFIQGSDSNDNGATWSTSVEISSTDFTEDRASAAYSADGTPIAAWSARIASSGALMETMADSDEPGGFIEFSYRLTADNAAAGLPATGAPVPVPLAIGGVLALMVGAGVLVWSRARVTTK
jgi:hypothetical protein